MTARSKPSNAIALSRRALKIADEEEERARLAKRAHQLRLSGKTWWEIAETLKIPEMQASGLVADRIRAAAALVDEGAKRQMLSMELDRLDTLQQAIWDDAVGGDTKAVETALKIIAQRAKLLGLEDAMVGRQVTNNTIVVPGNATEYVAALRAMTGSE